VARSSSDDQLTAYERFYALCERPFSLTPDLRFAFDSRSHAHAMEEVAEALRHREGLIVVTGEIGTGKTMLCRAMLETFSEARTFLSVILDPGLSVDDLLYQVLADFGVTTAARPHHRTLDEVTRHQLVSTLQQFLASLIPLNAHAVIMIDEAQHLDASVLEQLRLLSNFETDGAKLLQIVLVGQPDLDAKLQRPEMRQLNQRVARRVQLQPLEADEVKAYVERRIAVATCPDSFPVAFDEAAIAAVRACSGGIPRLVNTLCDRALEVAFERQLPSIDADAVQGAAAKLQLPSAPPAAATREPRRREMSVGAVAAAAVVLLAAAFGGAWWWLQPPAESEAPAWSIAQVPPAPTATPRPAATAAPSPTPTSAPAAIPTTGVPTATPAPANRPAPAASPGPATAGSFEVVVAAFRTSKRAGEVAADLVAKGLPATTRQDPSQSWYLVVVGPYPTVDAAQTTQRTLARGGFADAHVGVAGAGIR